MNGPLTLQFVQDHRRLDALLRQARCGGERIDTAAYAAFRAGILRHIGMEERVLLPAAKRARGGRCLPVARLLRLDHGALASLLVPFYFFHAGLELRRVELTGKEARFTLEGDGPPTAVELDPRHRLLIWTPEYGPRPGT